MKIESYLDQLIIVSDLGFKMVDPEPAKILNSGNIMKL